MACSPCADLCVCLSIYQHVNLNAHSICTEVCLSAFSPEFVTANGYNSRPGAFYSSTGSSGNSSQGKLWRIRRIWYVFFGIFNQRNVEYSSHNVLTCFSNLNSYTISVCVCVCRLQWHSWRILRKPPICTRLHNSTYSILYRRTDGGRADRGGH